LNLKDALKMAARAEEKIPNVVVEQVRRGSLEDPDSYIVLLRRTDGVTLYEFSGYELLQPDQFALSSEEALTQLRRLQAEQEAAEEASVSRKAQMKQLAESAKEAVAQEAEAITG
jgi:hypothetical protein